MMIEFSELPTETVLKKLAHEFPQIDPIAVAAHIRIRNLASQVNRVTERQLNKFGLSIARAGILIFLYDNEAGLPPSEIARLLGVSRANLTNMVEALQEQGLIKRETNKSDGRIVQLQLTPKGRSLCQEFVPVHFKLLGVFNSELTESDLQNFNLFVEKVRRGIRNAIENSAELTGS